MHSLIFGHSFTGLVALILVPGLILYFINKKKASVRKNAEDADTITSGLLTAPTEATSDRSSSSPTKVNNNVSGSSTVPSGNSYEVFLSFRGPDTRNGFADHLYSGLVGAGIRAFKDDEELRQGQESGPDLLSAIKNSKILITILSERYGSSKWCLEELVRIMECRNNNTGCIVLPIFYKVAPAHVQYLIGKFGEAFHEYERRERGRCLDPMILRKWKEALKEVGSLKGREANGSEVELVKSVVQQVLFELKKSFDLVTPENLVGIEDHVKEVMKILDNKSLATLFVGIHGMGGIGKTTLAKVIYNKLFDQFEYRSFIADIRESCKCNGLEHLQHQLIFDILKHNKQVYNKDEGIKFISSKFKDKKVLIFLDDVDDDDQLKALAGNHNWFASESMIFITTRNKGVLDKAGVHHIYELKEMGGDNSLILFSRHAFRRDTPPSEFKDLAHDVVSTTGGLPLSLEVLGSLFCGKEPKLWRGIIQKLRKVPHQKVREKLRISYEALEHGQKQIFLDIACFFIGTSRRIASYMWDACGFFPEEGIEVLRFMSLIKVADNHELKMHEQLRDLGREIIREENQEEPQYRSRLWNSSEALKVLKGNKGTKRNKAICLSPGETDEQGQNILTGEQFKKLRNLRFLDARGAHFTGDFKNSTGELRWLRWHDCPLTFEADNFCVEGLVVLELSRSEISDNWKGWSFIKMAENLKFLDLTRCESLEGSIFLSAFKNLEVLIFKRCRNLEKIDSSIGDMKSLVRLNLSGCISLKELPAEVSKLKKLEQLNLEECRNISAVPDNIGALQNLEILDICRTQVKELPDGIGDLQNLEVLNICHTKIKVLPGSIGASQKLKSLDISYTGIKEIPSTIKRLRKLKKLDASRCMDLESLPELPSSLTYLSITCRSNRMPSLFHLNHLKELHIIGCKSLKCILEIPFTLLELSECSQLTDVEESELQKSLNTSFELEILEIFCCESMDRLDVSQLKYLKTLSAQCCYNIREVVGLNKLKCLESVTITGYTSIERKLLPKGKKKLHVENCKNLVEIQGLDMLEFLEELCISHCDSIQKLALPKLEGMKRLEALCCKNLVEIQGLEKLKFLEKLSISGSPSIQRLNLSTSRSLMILKAQIKDLVEIQGLDTLEFLKTLSAFQCTSIKRLDLSKSKGIKVLHTQHCKSLVEIQGVHGMEVLAELDISGCVSIESLDLPKSDDLKVLNATNCGKLVKIQGLDRLEFLAKLYITGCASIECLNLSKSRGLKILMAKSCKNLIEIQGLDSLEFLEKLYISEDTSIKRLELPNSNCLKILDTKNCKNLVEIQGLDRLECLEELYISGCGSIEMVDLPKSERLKILETSGTHLS